VHDIALDPGDSVVVAGYTSDEAFRYDITAIKYSPSGSPLWVALRSFGDTSSMAQGIATDASGNVYLVGQFVNGMWVTMKFPPSGPGVAEGVVPEAAAGCGLVCIPSIVNTQCVLSLACHGHIQALAITVADIAGRKVRELELTERAGRVSATWDGRDAHGSPVTDGIYLASVQTRVGMATVKLIVRH
jgi:hypothetical protein